MTTKDQEPVAWMKDCDFYYANEEHPVDAIPLYLHPAPDLVAEKDAEIEQLQADLHSLAVNTEYRGNSVAYWHSKSAAYKEALGKCWDALEATGVNPDGKTSVADAIRKRADQTEALVAAAYRAAADVCESNAKQWAVYRDHYNHRDAALEDAKDIRALTPADAERKLRELMMRAMNMAWQCGNTGSNKTIQELVDEVLHARP